jgi:hypothetical protein
MPPSIPQENPFWSTAWKRLQLLGPGCHDTAALEGIASAESFQARASASPEVLDLAERLVSATSPEEFAAGSASDRKASPSAPTPAPAPDLKAAWTEAGHPPAPQPAHNAQAAQAPSPVSAIFDLQTPSTELPSLVAATDGSGHTESIQYMPPGRHTITALQGDQPVTLTLEVGPDTAEVLDRFLQDQRRAAHEGREDYPFLDFNHEDAEAAGWPTRIYWGGDHPQSGGVRALVRWNAAGRRALAERIFTRFSPTFTLDAEGRINGSTTNMGGLVNRAAFKTIHPVAAKEHRRSSDAGKSDEPPAPTTPTEPDPSNAVNDPSNAKANNPAPAGNQAPPAGATAAGSPSPSADPPTPTPSPAPAPTEDRLLARLRSAEILPAEATTPEQAADYLQRTLADLSARLAEYNHREVAARRARLETLLERAITAGAIDTEDRAFWTQAHDQHPEPTERALLHLSKRTGLLNRVADEHKSATDPASRMSSRMQQQEDALNAARLAHPEADFSTVYAHAKAEHPRLFR